jgi:glutathione synthase/RimK-type ligase-like ATP-grasp enzyme
MILLCGIPSEPPLAMVAESLDQIGAQYRIFNQRHFGHTRMILEVRNGTVAGWLELDGEGIPLESITGVYIRLMDPAKLPELEGVDSSDPAWRSCQAMHNTLARWCEIAPCRVVNRTADMASNSSKPYQAQLIRAHGFDVPETLVTNDPVLVREFRERHGRIIYKSTSGARSIVQTFEDADLSRLHLIRLCPVQFQVFVPGTDVRVHVVGQDVFPTEVLSTATDYRYAAQQVGASAELRATELPSEIANSCINLTAALGLAFSGIDLRLTPDGRFFCFEVNPSPGFSYYEANANQPISAAVARYLANENAD